MRRCARGASRSRRSPRTRTAQRRARYTCLSEDADALALDRKPEEYRCAPLVELHLLDWGRTIARRCLYEVADEIRIAALMEDGDARVAGLAAKINREEAYHRMHAEMWRERLAETPKFRAAVDELWPYVLGVLPAAQREALAARLGREPVDAIERGSHDGAFTELHDEMTMGR